MPVTTSTRRFAVVASVVVGVSVLCGGTPAAAEQSLAPAALDQSVSGLGLLTDLAITRLLVGDQVAAAKFGTDLPIDDPVREQQILDQVRQRAVDLGIDPEETVRFFQDQITASKIVQRGLFRLWTAHPELAPTTRPDLGTIRQELDRITGRILEQLKSTQDIRHRNPLCRAQKLAAQLAGEIIHQLDALHRRALDAALRSVCSPG